MQDGTSFVFKQKGQLFQVLQKAHLGNDDTDEVFLTQITLQLAVSGMTIEEIEREFGPIQVINTIEKAF